MMNATKRFNLERKRMVDDNKKDDNNNKKGLGIWDGKEFLFEETGNGYWDTAKFLWRYGYSAVKVQFNLYKIERRGLNWQCYLLNENCIHI